jgi:hypothetical protein
MRMPRSGASRDPRAEILREQISALDAAAAVPVLGLCGIGARCLVHAHANQDHGVGFIVGFIVGSGGDAQ